MGNETDGNLYILQENVMILYKPNMRFNDFLFPLRLYTYISLRDRCAAVL